MSTPFQDSPTVAPAPVTAPVETQAANPWAEISNSMNPVEVPVDTPIEVPATEPVAVTPPPVVIDPSEFADLRQQMDELRNQVAPPPAPAPPHYAGYFDETSGFTSSVDVANIRELYSESAPEMVAMAEDYQRLVDVVNNALLPMVRQAKMQSDQAVPIVHAQMVDQVKSTFNQAAEAIKAEIGFELSGDDLGRGIYENLPKLIEANGGTYTIDDLKRWWYSYNTDKVLAARSNSDPSNVQAPTFPVAPPVNGVSAVTPGAATTEASRIFAAFQQGNQGRQ